MGRLWWGAWCSKQHRFPSVGVPCDGGSGGHGAEGWETGGGETALEALIGALWEEIRVQAPIVSVAPENIPGGVWPSPTLHGGGDRGELPSLDACSDRSSRSLQGPGASLLFPDKSVGLPATETRLCSLEVGKCFCVPVHLPICQWERVVSGPLTRVSLLVPAQTGQGGPRWQGADPPGIPSSGRIWICCHPFSCPW